MDYTQTPPSTDDLPPPADSEEHLPTYTEARSASRFPTAHAFHLIKGDEYLWLTLVLHSSAGAPSVVPYFFGGDRVEGHVALDLKEPATFRSIDVTVRSLLMCCMTGAAIKCCM
jgi:hypothetical protein